MTALGRHIVKRNAYKLQTYLAEAWTERAIDSLQRHTSLVLDWRSVELVFPQLRR
jgi:hypothetical protein